ncbi:MAG: glycosyltransferase [Chloroflexi bacterium]|nr:glycosyltransferase [Chloroflexota bacterium]
MIEESMSDVVAIFSPSLEIGGAEQGVVNLANGFVQYGKNVDLLLATAEGTLLSAVHPHVNIVDLGRKGVFGAFFPLVNYLKIEHPVFLISVQTHASLIALWARAATRVTTKNILVEVTTMSLNYGLEPGLKNKLIPLLARYFYRFADAVVCLTRGIEDDLRSVTGLSEKKMYQIYNPVLPNDVSKKTKQPIAHPWFEPGSPPVLITLGRLTAAKDYPTLLQAFALARQKGEMRLLFLGDGRKRNELERLATSLDIDRDVQFLGFVENPYPYLARSSVFVLSSAWEGLSHVLVEALACGLPIVSTDCKSGPAEVLENGKYGTLVPVGDSVAMASAILDALNVHPDHDRLQRRSRDFTLSASIEKYLSLFDELQKNNKK